jgi:SAM-dependent methyltransferase
MRALADYLPAPPARLLDIGGGPGRYAIALAGRGYDVTLLDLSAAELEYARSKAEEAGVELEGYLRANALDLGGLAPESYDAVLLMGPLYHLLSEEERRRSLLEARRVLKPGGPIFAAFITRYAPLRFAAKVEPDLLLTGYPPAEELLAHGMSRPPEGGYFTQAYFTHPSEIEPLLESCGFAKLDLVGCEGLVARVEEKVNELDGELWEAWVDLNYRVGKDPCLYGASEHLLYVGRRPY